MQYFEDIEPGERHSIGSYTITKEEITEFAQKYDPQPFHLDEDAAAESIYGGLIASGWQTIAICMRMLVDELVNDQASMGARGANELRWIRPVRPGDTISLTTEVLETRPAERNPEVGEVDTEIIAYNQDGDPVVRWIALGLVARRDAE
jgi:acyl dehydratase